MLIPRMNVQMPPPTERKNKRRKERKGKTNNLVKYRPNSYIIYNLVLKIKWSAVIGKMDKILHLQNNNTSLIEYFLLSYFKKLFN